MTQQQIKQIEELTHLKLFKKKIKIKGQELIYEFDNFENGKKGFCYLRIDAIKKAIFTNAWITAECVFKIIKIMGWV